jgi:hypothetical protein
VTVRDKARQRDGATARRLGSTRLDGLVDNRVVFI